MTKSPPPVVIGVHIGQNRMPSAIAVVEFDRRAGHAADNERRSVWHYSLRYLQPLPAGSSYIDTASRLEEIVTGVQQLPIAKAHVCVEATGQGSPVIQTVTRRLPKKIPVWTVQLNHGDGRKADRSNRTVILGKAYLVFQLKVVFQEGRLHLAKTSKAHELSEQILAYDVRPEQIDATRPGAFSVGPQDHLVTAVGLAVQMEPSVSVYPGGRTNFGLK